MFLAAIATGASASKTVHVYARGWGDMTGYKIAAYGWRPTEFFTDLQPDNDYPPCYKITIDDNCDYLIFCKFDANATNNWENTNTQTHNVDVYQEGTNDVLVIITEGYEENHGTLVYKCECTTIDKLGDYVTNVETGADEFVCELKSGATVTWQLTETPTVELKDGRFAVSSTRATVSYAAEDVKRFVLQKNLTAIDAPKAGSNAQPTGTAQWAGTGQLLISGCKAAEAVAVYAADGRRTMLVNAENNGSLTITTGSLPAGVYIVKSQSINLKFARK